VHVYLLTPRLTCAGGFISVHGLISPLQTSAVWGFIRMGVVGMEGNAVWICVCVSVMSTHHCIRRHHVWHHCCIRCVQHLNTQHICISHCRLWVCWRIWLEDSQAGVCAWLIQKCKRVFISSLQEFKFHLILIMLKSHLILKAFMFDIILNFFWTNGLTSLFTHYKKYPLSSLCVNTGKNVLVSSI